MKIFLLLLIHIGFLSSVLADTQGTCPPLDLSKSPGLEAPLNRDGIGWCYAYSAADLISFKLKQRVSSFDAGLQFHNMIRQSLWKRFTHAKTGHMLEIGGNIQEVLEAAQMRGLCSEKELPSDYSGNDLYNYLRQVESFKLSDVGTPRCDGISQFFPALMIEDMKKVLSRYEGEARLIELAGASCRQRIQVPSLKVRNVDVAKDPQLKTLDEQLNKNNIVSLSQDMSFLFYGPDHKPKKRVSNHQVTVVGRRFKEGKCQYQLKGSSGRHKNYRYAEPYRSNNSGGYVWVDRETLARFSDEMTYVE